MELMDTRLLYQFWEATRGWIVTNGLKIILIIIIARIACYVLSHILERAIRKFVTSKGSKLEIVAEQKREDTLIKIFVRSSNVIIWIIAGLMILAEIGLDIGPLLAAAGVAGLAFGFGGQYLIRDLISGTFIIIENQFRVGDVVCFDGTCGVVEDITMRMTTLRDLDAIVHHVPNGQINKVSNLTKGYSRINLNIGVAYDSNLDSVIKVINQVGKEMSEDVEWKEHILKAPAFLRVDDFGDSAIIMKILGDTVPLKQWDVAGEYRRRIKSAFDKEGIVIPFPQRDVHNIK